MKRAFVLILLVVFGPLSPANAGELDALVRSWYRPYESNTGGPSALRLLRPHASTRLAALIAREERCAAKSGGICNLDFDVIVNGQDWALKNLRVEPEKLEGDRASAMARFTNFDTAQEVVYRFIRESGRWRLDDVEARLPRAQRWTLSRLLAR